MMQNNPGTESALDMQLGLLQDPTTSSQAKTTKQVME